MKLLESIGTIFAAIGFYSLSAGDYSIGFVLGIFSCVFLLPVLYYAKLYQVFFLQLFFLYANINGILNNLG